MTKHRNTSQRAKIYEVAKTLYHPSAEEVYSAVGKQCEGKFTKVCFRGEPARYDTNIIPHDHFVCEKCGAIIDFPPASESDEKGDIPFGEYKGLLIKSKSVTYYGICDKCRK